MSDSTRLQAMAHWMWEARQRRLPYRNLPDDLRPASIAQAYAAQEAYYRLAESTYGAVTGAKIATTTKVMQALMGVDHPDHSPLAGQAARGGFRQSAHRKRDRTATRHRPAGFRRAVDARARRTSSSRGAAGL